MEKSSKTVFLPKPFLFMQKQRFCSQKFPPFRGTTVLREGAGRPKKKRMVLNTSGGPPTKNKASFACKRVPLFQF